MARTKASRLTLAFIDKRPGAAARVLESLPVEDAAGFINSIPTRYAIKVLSPLNTTLTTHIVQRLPADSLVALLREMEFVLASAVLRRIPDDFQKMVLQELPDKRRQEFSTVLNFPAESVGANMHLDVVTASGDETVADALRRMKDDRHGQSDAVFIVDKDQKPVGSVRLTVLARQRSGTALKDLLDEGCPPVAARTRMSQITSLAAWHLYSQLPVVSRRGELIGIIHKQAVIAESGKDTLWPTENLPTVVESLLRTLVGATPALADIAKTPPSRSSDGGPSDER